MRVLVAMSLLVTGVWWYWESLVKIERKRILTERIVVAILI
jgi:hypothetical protein